MLKSSRRLCTGRRGHDHAVAHMTMGPPLPGAERKDVAMTVARSLAEFLTQVSYADLPQQTVDHAAMLIASTIASAALGSRITSATIIRTLARERGGTPEASIWFDPGPKLPVADAAQVNAVMSDAAASAVSDLRYLVHAGTN